MNDLYDARPEELIFNEEASHWARAIMAVVVLVSAIAAIVESCKNANNEGRD